MLLEAVSSKRSSETDKIQVRHQQFLFIAKGFNVNLISNHYYLFAFQMADIAYNILTKVRRTKPVLSEIKLIDLF